MTNLKDTREELAALFSANLKYSDQRSPEGKPFRVIPRPKKGNLRRGDGFVTVPTTVTGEFIGSFMTTFNVYLVLGADETLADADVDELSVPAVDLVTQWRGMDVSIQPQSMVGGESFVGEIYVLVLTCTVDVTS